MSRSSRSLTTLEQMSVSRSLCFENDEKATNLVTNSCPEVVLAQFVVQIDR